MKKMNKEKIFRSWKHEYEKESQRLLPDVINLRSKIQNEVELRVWLGGPGKKRNDNLYTLRRLIGEFLEKLNINVIYSEDFMGCADIVAKETEECEALDATFVLCMSSGSSAESIEFAHNEMIKSKMNIYIPTVFKEGFVYQALNNHFRITNDHSLINFKKFKKYGSEVPIKILTQAVDYRTQKYRQLKMSA